MSKLIPRVAILHNRPSAASSEASETGVMREVADVQGALDSRGYATEAVGVGGRDLCAAVAALAERSSDTVVFNLCEGLDGQSVHEATVAGLLHLRGIRFTGSAAATLTIALDKRVAKALLAMAGVATARCQVFRTVPRPEIARDLAYPVVVKPLREDASVGVTAASFVRTVEELRLQVGRVLEQHGQPALAEAYLPGREFNVALTGEGKEARVLPVAEIRFEGYGPGEPRIVTHDAKWNEGSAEDARTIPECPAAVEPALRARIEDAALTAYRVFECRDYARVDLRLDARGRPHVLEVNPNPDISRDAGLARAVRAAGISYEEFVAGLVQRAWVRG